MFTIRCHSLSEDLASQIDGDLLIGGHGEAALSLNKELEVRKLLKRYCWQSGLSELEKKRGIMTKFRHCSHYICGTTHHQQNS